jgi:prepilin-type N-terminal cleavage/methylation domain-containing protein
VKRSDRSSTHPIRRVRRVTRGRTATTRAQRGDESGFTLIELIIVVAVLPIIVGAMAAGLLSVISFTPTISNKLSDSGDAQALSTSFTKDVEGATMVTTAAASTSPSACGTGTQILGLQYPNGQWISYSLITQGAGPAAKQNLFRNDCQTGTPTLLSSVILSHNVVSTTGTGSPSATVTCTSATPTPPSCAGTPPAWSTNWVSTAQVVSVNLGLTYAASDYTQALVATPTAGVNAAGGSTLNAPPFNCGFATPDTGTYASTLCFIDFTALNPPKQGTPCGNGGLQITDGITNTPFTISFCMSVTGGPVVAASIPTYTSPPASEAFLGNNGFYTGIPGNPAVYQNQEGTNTTVTITNIQVLGSGGVPATNWNLITGDAESTDAGESISWTAGWSATTPVKPANQVFSLVPNSPTSAIGNACANPTPGSGLNVGNGLTGVGTNSVQCQASVSSDKTGTVMISTPVPNSLSVFMVGTGLEGMFMGILLPA